MARSTWLSAAAIAVLAIGCGTSGTGDTGSDSIKVPVGPAHHQPPPPPPEACRAIGAPGSIVSSEAIVGGAIVAVDAQGNVFYTNSGGNERAGQGIVKQTATGTRVYTFPYGSVFAIDAEGNAYVAGSFTAPIDLGNGTLNPIGNIDVFVAKLSPRGTLIFAEQLGLCGDGVESIAVAADGRIAVSGTSMGTAILDASGKLLEQVFYAGHLAFDSHGNLYVAGSFTGSLQLDSGHVLTAGSATDTDAFVVKLDDHANYITSLQIGDAALPITVGYDRITVPQVQIITGIAINAHDQIAILGTFPREMNLFGKTLTFQGVLPSGSTLSVFAAKLDASLAPVFGVQLSEFYDYNRPGGIAIDGEGNVLVSSNIPGEAFYPNGHPTLIKLDAATGANVWGYTLDNGDGYGLGVAVNACGNVVWAELNHTRVIMPLMTTLHLVAR